MVSNKTAYGVGQVSAIHGQVNNVDEAGKNSNSKHFSRVPIMPWHISMELSAMLKHLTLIRYIESEPIGKQEQDPKHDTGD